MTVQVFDIVFNSNVHFNWFHGGVVCVFFWKILPNTKFETT